MNLGGTLFVLCLAMLYRVYLGLLFWYDGWWVVGGVVFSAVCDR